MTTVTTLLYDGNYRHILNDSSWFMNYQPSYTHQKLITVNNVSDRDEIESILKGFQKKYDFNYFFVTDFEDDAKKFFKVDIDKERTVGYYYQIPYYSLLLFLETDYVLNVSADCSKNLVLGDDFVTSSIEELETNPNIFTTSVSWGRPEIEKSFGYELGEWEELQAFKKRPKLQNDKFWHTEGFGDNLFFSKTSNLKSVDYNLIKKSGSPCEWVPYCPICWETRVCEYTYQKGAYRGIWKNSNYYYFHEKF